ncbi:MAG: hypothetical protein ACD_7C00382G0002 [uncultured bacterium]|nr:MAG: hypothetical protein ACD_7C00382G0002 [uncultured bacterium]KKP68240.1 MAG: hypothetical protein UR66_C0007G0047 [Candidatus Moranbacteria bacterium GW2011_GWE1_35_17]KKP71799.1 MAG: hypothetical protein UR65_C0026G0010 [Candidatus Moranbacteria bacterium GW2011_GWE2_35_164]KKP81486.1 MAG: hypothetical protein UR82_C0060G0008 [Candidatus Moranbacteria bacterium GW2011_GWF1_35_5]KKP84522.1 MAG: hypothetical protein UR83_C0019G0015 [Candidatus Moranbacteria bacterium GW2011_GWF2_35_54]
MEIEKIQKVAKICKNISFFSVFISPLTALIGFLWAFEGGDKQGSSRMFLLIMFFFILYLFTFLSKREYEDGHYGWSLFFSSVGAISFVFIVASVLVNVFIGLFI